ncbi:hypothetical protein [Croceiramulus getboli]|nr:hypothetical protein P8624_03625 [Flavobacteriaceae bacterium YJPT1-3]
MNYLKKITVLLMVSLTLAACSSDDDGGTVSAEASDLVGTWK